MQGAGQPAIIRKLSAFGLRYQMMPEQYRAKWNLPADYPMVAPDYAEKRRTLAKSIGLGRKPGTKLTTARTRAPRKAEATPETADAG